MKKKINTSWSAEKFHDHLLNKGLSFKVCNDHLSRCRRIERVLNVNLIVETSSEVKFHSLILKLHNYASKGYKKKININSLVSTLMVSARKFSLFQHGSKASMYKQYVRMPNKPN